MSEHEPLEWSEEKHFRGEGNTHYFRCGKWRIRRALRTLYREGWERDVSILVERIN